MQGEHESMATQQWEYQSESVEDKEYSQIVGKSDWATLHKRGEEGWELVSVAVTQSPQSPGFYNLLYFFKRPKAERRHPLSL